MKRLMLSTLLLLAYTHLVYSQESGIKQYGDAISETRLKKNLTIIASDSMEGRETGKKGQKMAADFIRAYFKGLNLTAPVNGDYYQTVNLYTTGPGDTYLKTDKKKLINFEDVLYYGQGDSEGEVSIQLVYAGLGREEDFSTLDVKDKAVLIRIDDGRLYSLPEVTRAREKGAKMIFIWNTDAKSDFMALVNQAKVFQGNASISIKKPTVKKSNSGHFILSPDVVESLMAYRVDLLKKAARENPEKKALQKIKPVSITYKTETAIHIVESENVLGFLEGTDKKDEVVIITAHYDHVGREDEGKGDLIYNGADDDGSGTVAVMEIARVFTKAKEEGKGPRRSILFMTVTAEEKGLLGSSYYTQNPVFPLSQTVVDLNIDMIGRRDPQHKESDPYVYVIGSDKLSSELYELNENMNKKYTRLIFDYTYNDENHPSRLYYRSDHWNFAKNNIPIIFYFDGIHEDYHKPGDEIEKIEFDLLRKRTQCIFYTAWEIANREERIKHDGNEAK